jgi:ubiquinone/menaquinone biosynthesis C-methylase UbiE
MTDNDVYIQRLLESNPLREPLLRSVIHTLQLPQWSRGLDAGCGIGMQALLLAEAIGVNGHVTGLDISPAFIRYAEEMVEGSEFADRISFQEGDLSELPFEADCFDWVWSVDCVGYPTGDLLPILQELTRVVRPGGSVNILAWSSQSLLPGYPMLEARLNANCSVFNSIFQSKRPETHFMRALGWFKKAGLEDARGQSFVGDVQAPMSGDIRKALISLFQMLWGEPESEAPQEDWREYQRLCTPESPEFILTLSDYYAFFTYTLFRGTVPG